MRGKLDAVALLTADPALVPLLLRLRSAGTYSVIVRTHIEFVDEAGVAQSVKTPPALCRHATSTMSLGTMLRTALADGWPLHAPLHSPDKDSARLRLPLESSDESRHRGTIHDWPIGRAYGFLLDAKDNKWFVHRDDLPNGMTTLPTGTDVEFSGDLTPSPGRSLPHARHITIDGRVAAPTEPAVIRSTDNPQPQHLAHAELPNQRAPRLVRLEDVFLALSQLPDA